MGERVLVNHIYRRKSERIYTINQETNVVPTIEIANAPSGIIAYVSNHPAIRNLNIHGLMITPDLPPFLDSEITTKMVKDSNRPLLNGIHTICGCTCWIAFVPVDPIEDPEIYECNLIDWVFEC